MVENATNNALKIAYLAKCYPDHTLSELIELFQLSAMDINVAIWQAQDLGMMELGDKDQRPTVTLPGVVEFDSEVNDLQEMLTYAFGKLNAEQNDMEEVTLTQWLRGYPSHNIFIALNELLRKNVLTKYELTDTDPEGNPVTYTFFTLTGNEVHEWGKKQFRHEPKAPEVKEEPVKPVKQTPTTH